MDNFFEQALVAVWRQVLVEDRVSVEWETKRYPVRQTPKSKLRQVDFVFEGDEIRGLEQNPETKSRWAQMARSGKKSDAVPESRPLRGERRRRETNRVWTAEREG